MPEGSSSAAPVMTPGPRERKIRTARAFGLSMWCQMRVRHRVRVIPGKRSLYLIYEAAGTLSSLAVFGDDGVDPGAMVGYKLAGFFRTPRAGQIGIDGSHVADDRIDNSPLGFHD